MIDYQKLKEVIQNNQSFLITTHVNPDADAIGSEIALYKILKNLNKKIKIVNYSSTPYNLEFLDAQKCIEKYDAELHNIYIQNSDVLVALDFNRASRMVAMENVFCDSSNIKICVDHHQDPEDFVDHQFVDSSYAATGQIIYEFIQRTGIIILDKEIAAPIYTAIMTDTGSFRFERTNSDLHIMISDLLRTGVNPSEIYTKVYDESKLSKIQLLGKALNSIKLIADNQIGYMVITQKNFNELNAIESDTDSFVNFILSIENVKVGLLFIELKKGFKVSFRSKGNIPINKLAGLYGGGGHLNAAGARFFNEDMALRIPLILTDAEKFLTNQI